MRDNCKVRTIGSIHEERQASHKTYHCRVVVGVKDSNANTHAAHHNTNEYKPELLGYYRSLGCAIYNVWVRG
jgi:hypothetical protein